LVCILRTWKGRDAWKAIQTKCLGSDSAANGMLGFLRFLADLRREVVTVPLGVSAVAWAYRSPQL
jgi:hypothetical protein